MLWKFNCTKIKKIKNVGYQRTWNSKNLLTFNIYVIFQSTICYKQLKSHKRYLGQYFGFHLRAGCRTMIIICCTKVVKKFSRHSLSIAVFKPSNGEPRTADSTGECSFWWHTLDLLNGPSMGRTPTYTPNYVTPASNNLKKVIGQMSTIWSTINFVIIYSVKIFSEIECIRWYQFEKNVTTFGKPHDFSLWDTI